MALTPLAFDYRRVSQWEFSRIVLMLPIFAQMQKTAREFIARCQTKS